MSEYVISDIHGCYDDLQEMLKLISFSDEDKLILAGDYIDRGPKNVEMLHWLEERHDNVVLLRGNHDEEFAMYVDILKRVDKENNLHTGVNSNNDLGVLYYTIEYIRREFEDAMALEYFDYYGTIQKMIDDGEVTLNDLCRWADFFRTLPYYYETKSKDRRCIVVHAGYADDYRPISMGLSTAEEFNIYAREEAIIYGGIKHGMVVAGHTPTIAEGEFCYNDGHIFCYKNNGMDCKYYFIDCGCAYRAVHDKAALACLRLEDRAEFYI